METFKVNIEKPWYVSPVLFLINRPESVELHGHGMDIAQEAMKIKLGAIRGVEVDPAKPDHLSVRCNGIISYLRTLKHLRAIIKANAAPNMLTITHEPVKA